MTLPVDAPTFLLGAGASAIAAITGATVTWLTTSARTRLQFLLDLHREYNSAAFCDTRARAHKMLQLNAKKNLQEIEILEDAHHVFAVIRFYQRLWLAVEHRQVPKKLVGRLFGEGFFLWFCEHFEPKLLPMEWQVSRDIDGFRNWFLRKHRRDSDVWIARAKHDIAKQPKRSQPKALPAPKITDT